MKINQYLFYVLFALAIAAGFGLAHLSYVQLVEPSQPYMIVDKEVPSEINPLGFEPVEITGKSPELGEKMIVTCRVPVIYADYVHYPSNWDSNIFNPRTWQGQTVKWTLYGILAIIVGLLVWRIVSIANTNRRKKTGGKTGEE